MCKSSSSKLYCTFSFDIVTSHRYSVVSKEAGHAAGAILNTERTAIVSVGAAQARVVLVMVVYAVKEKKTY